MFTYTALLWFLPLTGVVVLIHLINMFRHRRVEWAALEFLLAGYRKSRMRILFQQFLLMLLRTLAVAAVILMLAGPKLEGRLADWFGGRGTHHIVLLDDSYSMNDRNTAQGGTPVFEDAVTVLRQLVDGTAKRHSTDRVSLVRLSRALVVQKGEEPDLAEVDFGTEGLQIVENVIRDLKPSQFAGEPEELFAAATTLIRQSNARLKPVVYYISDFRQRNWENPTPVLKQLEEIRQLGGMVRMVRTVNEARPNLGVDGLELVDGIHAADIDLLVDAHIVNHGSDDAENVNVMLLVDEMTRSNRTIPKLGAGQRTSPPVRFSVRLEGDRPQRIEVQVQADAVPDDNRRHLVLEVPEALEVLIIAPQQRPAETDSARYVRVALSPGGTKSGVRTRVEPPGFLLSNPLTPYRAIFLLDLPTLESAAVRALEEYVEAGGGVAFFPGPDTDLDFVRKELYRDGAGLVPVAPIAETALEPDYLSRTPDVKAVQHPIFRLFGDGESPLLDSIKVERYIGVENLASTPATILATLRTGAPFVVEKEYGKGRTVTFLSTASSTWNNWARGNPSFVVVMLELAAWLAKRPQVEAVVQVGQPLTVSLDPTRFEPKITLRGPSENAETGRLTATLEAVMTGSETSTATFTRTGRAGFYEIELKERSGGAVLRYSAVNVDAREGDTRLVETVGLTEQLRSVGSSLESAAGFSTSYDFSGHRSLSDLLLYAVILLLLGEIFLAGRILPPVTQR